VSIPVDRITEGGQTRITQSGDTRSIQTTSRQALVPVSKEYINFTWPADTPLTTPSIPTMFAMLTDQTIITAPPPDQPYGVEVVGTVRPLALSAANTSTLLTTFLPDVFLAASMIFASGFQKNFGSQSDNPQMAQSWETQYQSLKSSAQVEEF